MAKPKLLIIDYKDQLSYKSIENICTLDVRDEPSTDFEGISGIICHTPLGTDEQTRTYLSLFRIAKQDNLPLIIPSNELLLEVVKIVIDSAGLDCPNIYYVKTYEDIFSKVRQLFSKDSS